MRFGVGALVIWIATSCLIGLTAEAAEQGKEQGKWSVSLPSDARPLEQSERPFFDAYRQAVNTHSVELYKRLVCPKCLAAINDSNKDYHEESFGIAVGEQIPADAVIGIVAMDPSAALPFGFEEAFNFPERPTHAMHIITSVDTGDVVGLAHSGDQWCVVMPSPKASTLADRAQLNVEAESRVKQLQDPLLSEIRALLKAGQTVAAIKQYHQREGVGLAVSKAVIFKLLKQQP